MNRDGIAYHGTLTLRSAEVLFDQYIAGPLHISPGFMFYNGNEGNANASVPGGQTFTLGGAAYVSQPGNPIASTGSIEARSVAPMILVGLGNLLPRSSRHFTLNLDAGVVYQGSPRAALHLTGGACDPIYGVCVDAATDPMFQTEVEAEQTKINNTLTAFRWYPVLSLTFGYRF